MVDIQIHCERSSLPKTRAWLLGFLSIYLSAFVVLSKLLVSVGSIINTISCTIPEV